MRNFIVLFLIVLVTACGTISADRTETAKQQVAEATAAWVAAYNSRDPARITSLYDPEAVFWGTSAKPLLQARLRLLSTLRMPARPRKRELLSANSIFVSMVIWP